jgi:hypothetical protein
VVGSRDALNKGDHHDNDEQSGTMMKKITNSNIIRRGVRGAWSTNNFTIDCSAGPLGLST